MKVLLVSCSHETPQFPPLWPAYLSANLRSEIPNATVRFVEKSLIPPRRYEDIVSRFGPDAIILSGNEFGDGDVQITTYCGPEEHTLLVRASEADRSEIIRALPQNFDEDETPHPDFGVFSFSLADLIYYDGMHETQRPSFAFRTSQGSRSYSPARVCAELQTLRSVLGVSTIQFLDENFVTDRSRAIEICRGITDAETRWNWACQCDPDMVDSELLEWMHKAGCFRITYTRCIPKAIEQAHAARIIVTGLLDETMGDAGSLRRRIDKLRSWGVRKLVIHGTGPQAAMAGRLAAEFGISVLAYSDNREGKRDFEHASVVLPSAISNLSPDAVLITSRAHQDAIHAQLAHLKAFGIHVVKGYDDPIICDSLVPAFDQYLLKRDAFLTKEDNASLLFWALPKGFQEMDVLDCGCGLYRGGNMLLRDLPFRKVQGIDIYEPYIDVVRKMEFPLWKNAEFELLAVENVLDRFGPASFDIALSFDVLEHLPREFGERLIQHMEEIARQRVIFWVPEGWLAQDVGDDGLDAWGYPNQYQTHQSIWNAEDFTHRGYRVCRVEGEIDEHDPSRYYSKLWAYKELSERQPRACLEGAGVAGTELLNQPDVALR